MRTLRGRLFLATLGTVLVGVGVSLAIGVVFTRQAVRDSIADDLSRQADLLSGRLSTLPDAGLRRAPGPPPGPPPQGIPLPPPRGERRAVPPPPPGGPPDRPEPQVVPLREAGRLLPRDAASRLHVGRGANGHARIRGRDLLFAARPVRGRVLLLTRPSAIGASDYGSYLKGLLIASALAALLAAAAAVLLSRWLAAPIRRVAQAARELPSKARPDPLPSERTAELGALVDAFNDMTTQLTRAREAERSVLLSVSHELRTPLTAIRGYAEGLSDGTVDSSQAAAVIGREAERLERLVMDLLALARLEQGVLEVRSETVDLAAVAREAEQRLAPQARERAVELAVKASSEAPATADQGRVLQVVSNLVDNALRVTPPGGRVSIEAEPGRLRVRDTGPGIAPQDIPHAFERFHLHRQEGSRDGSGLGLAIVKEMTEAMKGRVTLSSEKGSGSEFTVELPPVP